MDYCFCTLALYSPYRLLAKDLAKDLSKHAPKATLIVFSDQPDDFKDHQNVLAFKYHRKGIPHCWNDRRFVIEKSLTMYRTAIHIDADTRIILDIPERLEWLPGITAMTEDLLQHARRWMYPPDVKLLESLACKLKIPLEETKLIHESLYVVTRDSGRELEFLKQWDIITRTLELKGYTSSDGYLMGVAARRVNWNINECGWQPLKYATSHFFVGDRKPKTFWNRLGSKIKYLYRLFIARLTQTPRVES